MSMVGEACLPSNAYYYTLCSGVHVCWSEHSDSSFVYGFMSLDYGFGTMTATTFKYPTIDPTIPKEMKYNLHYGDVREDVLRSPRGTNTSCSVVK